MSSSWDDYADDWDANDMVRHYSDCAFKELQSQIPLEGLNILDFGCGTGCLTEKLSPIATSIVAMDPSTKMIEVLNSKKLNNVQSISDTLKSEIIRTHKLQNFDLIVASSVCLFLPDYEGMAHLFKKILSPTGTFIQWDWMSKDEDSSQGLTKKRITSALNNAGFKSVSVTSPFSLFSQGKDRTVLMGVGKNK
jgi:predicted TPR repeat methyltransferase